MPKEEEKKEEEKKLKFILARHCRRYAFLLAIIIIFFGYLFLILPENRKLLENKMKKQELEAAFQEKREEINSIKNEVVDYENLSPDLKEKINKILPKSKDFPNLYLQLGEISRESGLFLKSVQVEEKKEKVEGVPKNVGLLEIRLKLEGGDYASFKEFLNKLETNLRLFDVTSINFPPDLKSFGLTMRTYYFK